VKIPLYVVDQMVCGNLYIDLWKRGNENQHQEGDNERALTLRITRQSGIIIPPMSAFEALSAGAIEYSTIGDRSIVATASCSSI